MATTVTCDRCDASIRVEADRYEVSAPVRYTKDVAASASTKRYDLCKRCAEKFADWINPPRAREPRQHTGASSGQGQRGSEAGCYG